MKNWSKKLLCIILASVLFFHENLAAQDVILNNCLKEQLGNLTSRCLGNHGSVMLFKYGKTN